MSSSSGEKPFSQAALPSPSSASRPTMSHGSKTYPTLDENPGDHITVDVHSVQQTPEGEEADPLKVFHSALGIPPPKPIKPKKNVLGKSKPDEPPPKQPKLTAANKGVYHQVLTNERWARYQYYFCDTILTGAMFLQIIVGASVTAFGAGSANHVIITVFGAANTALASLLAVMKSQGLPNRLRQDWNGWRELREFIEEKEREIDMVIQGHAKAEGKLDIWKEVRGIEARYNTMRLTLEANRPDTYIKVPPVVLPR